MVFGEAVDDSTTVTGAFEKGAEMHPNSPASPYVSALASVLGGSVVRYFERKGRGLDDVKTEWTKPTGSIQKGCLYIVLYAAMTRLLGVSKKSSRLGITLVDCFTALAQELFPSFENPVMALWRTLAKMSAVATVQLTVPLRKQPAVEDGTNI